MDYSWRTVRCASEVCGCVLLLGNIGPTQQYRHTVLPPRRFFTVMCPECKTAHTYGPSDVEEQIVDDSSKGMCPTFLQAISPAATSRDENGGAHGAKP